MVLARLFCEPENNSYGCCRNLYFLLFVSLMRMQVCSNPSLDLVALSFKYF